MTDDELLQLIKSTKELINKQKKDLEDFTSAVRKNSLKANDNSSKRNKRYAVVPIDWFRSKYQRQLLINKLIETYYRAAIFAYMNSE